MQTLRDFAVAITHAQKDRGLTAKELAARTGLSDQAVRTMLHGEAAPRLTNAMALADALGMELVLMPKAAADGFRRSASSEPASRTVISDVERRLGVAVGSPGGSAAGPSKTAHRRSR
ncbi:MAG: XRE family transcriptional regulator [Comamonadaceae bacterium]|nr:MAG: XRE family transcriptional regulator [Comamonadaceae bacterium]